MLSPLTPACVLFHFSLWSIRVSLHLVGGADGQARTDLRMAQGPQVPAASR